MRSSGPPSLSKAPNWLLLTAISIVGIVEIGGASRVAAATPSPECLAKAAQIEERITEVRARGIERELKGLNKALSANRAHCTTALLERERQKTIKEASEKVSQRKAELKTAELNGDPQQISKRRAKLDAAEGELRDAKLPLPR